MNHTVSVHRIYYTVITTVQFVLTHVPEQEKINESETGTQAPPPLCLLPPDWLLGMLRSLQLPTNQTAEWKVGYEA